MLKVEKYGGSSVSSIDKIKQIAQHLKEEVESNNKVIVVFSAMGKTTNNLLNEVLEISKTPNLREVDQLLTIGEQKSVCLGALCLSEKNVRCISLNAKDINLYASNNHTNGLIKSIDKEKIDKYLGEYDVLFICGFQGINEDFDYITLGRGGSDTTAVAIAATLKAPCYIYTDVDKVYSIDPNMVEYGKKYDTIGYNTMIEMASLGSGVLITRSVILAYMNDVELYLAKSLSKEGTKIEKDMLEKDEVKGISKIDNLTLVRIKKDDYINNIDLLKDVKLDMVNIVDDNVSFVLNELEFSKLSKSFDKLDYTKNISKISLVGCGIASKGNNLTKLFNVLIKNSIDISYINTSEFAISFICDSKNNHIIGAIAEEFDLLK